MAIWRFAKIILACALAIFVAVTALRAFDETIHNSQFPDDLAIKVELLPWIFPIHMATGGLALLLVPLAIWLRLTAWHKLAGRIAATDVLVAGVTAIPVALMEPVTPISAAGFSVQALTWLSLLAAGIWNIRRGNAKMHQACMLMMAAVTSGAVFFRLYLATWAAFGTRAHFKTFYAFDAWVAWALPLALMAFWVRGRWNRAR